MAEPRRFWVISPDGAATLGFELRQAAETAACAYGDGAHVVDTLAMPYEPMAQIVHDGAPTYVGFGAWDTRVGLEQNLIEAVKKGYPPLVRAFLAKGARPDAADLRGGTALIWAAARGSAEIVRLLIAAGADVNARDAEGNSALMLARRKTRTEIAEILVAAGARD